MLSIFQNHVYRDRLSSLVDNKSDYDITLCEYVINTLRPIQHGLYFPDDILNWILLNEYIYMSLIKIASNFVPSG